MIGWLVAVAAAAPDPLLVGAVPDDADVTIVRAADTWTIVADGRSVVVPAPRSDAEQDAIRALVVSLLSDLELVPGAPLPMIRPVPVPPPPPTPSPSPPPVVVVVPAYVMPAMPAMPAMPPMAAPVAAQAPPPPVAAPVAPASVVASAAPPPPAASSPVPVALWVGLEAMVRPDVGGGPGAVVGLRVGEQGGTGLRVAARTPRHVSIASGSDLTEVDADLELWGALSPALTAVAAGGASGRIYTAYDTIVTGHVIPRASAGLVATASTRRVDLGFGLAGELDLASTRIGRGQTYQRLSPIGARFETRIAIRREPSAGSKTDER